MYKKEIEKFNNLVENVDFVSFDIFDTLLIRPYIKAEDLFEHIEELCKAKGFKKERILAEKRARYTFSQYEDITIDDIYENICPEFKELKIFELELEKQILRPNPFIKHLYDKAKTLGKKIIATSDMYLPEEFLKDVLYKNGFTDIAKVYVSSEYKKTKYTKSLYKEIVEELKTQPQKIIHIGDNLQSDYFNAIDSGFKAIFFEKYINKFFKTKNGKKYAQLSEKKYSLDFSIITAMSAIKLSTKSNDYWYNLAYNIGGAFAIGYIQYIIEQCKLNDINNLLFVSRDGYILQKVYNILSGKNALENHYIYAPRILNIKCFLDYRNSFVYLKNIFEMNKDICTDFKNPPDTFEEAKNLFNKNIKIIQNRAKEHYIEYQKYVEQLEIKNNRIATIDMTTGSFSSQAFLSNVFGNKVILGIFSGTFLENTEFKYKTFVNRNFVNEDIPKINILELLFTAPELPLDSIKDTVPIYKKPSKDDLFRLEIYPSIEQGILDFVDTYKDIFGKYSINLKSEVCFDLLDLVTELHSQQDKFYMNKVRHSKDVNNIDFKAIYSDLQLPNILKQKFKKSIMEFKKRCKLIVLEKYKLVKFYLYETKNTQ